MPPPSVFSAHLFSFFTHYLQSLLAIEFLEDPFPANFALSGALIESSEAGEFMLYNLDAIRKTETTIDNMNTLNTSGINPIESSAMQLIPVKNMSGESSTLPAGIFHIAQRPNTHQLAVTTLSTRAHILRLKQKKKESEEDVEDEDIDMMNVGQEVHNEHTISSQQQSDRAAMNRANGHHHRHRHPSSPSSSSNTCQLEIEYDLAGHTGGCATVRINSDKAVTACFDGHIRVFDLPPSSPKSSIDQNNEAPTTAATANNNNNNGVPIKNFNTNNITTTSNQCRTPEVLHPIATFTDDREHTHQPPLTEQNRGVCGLALSSTAHRIVSGSNDMQIKVWDTATGRITLRLGGCYGWPWWVEGLDSELNTVATSSTDGYVRVWDLRAGQPSLATHLSTDSINDIYPVATVVPRVDGNYLVAGSFDTSIYVIDRRMGRVVKDLRGHTDRLARVALTGDTLLSCAFDGKVALHGFG